MKRCHVTFQGFWRLQVIREKSGIIKKDTGWFPNLILNTGLDHYGAATHLGTALSYAYVGTGTSTPVATQTQLDNRLGGGSPASRGRSSSASNIAAGIEHEDPYYVYRRRRFQFDAGNATGNLTEIGVGSLTTGLNLFSRALIVDEHGDPTTLTVASDEILRAEYELRVNIPINDVGGVLTLDGVSTNWAGRAHRINLTTSVPGSSGWMLDRAANFTWSYQGHTTMNELVGLTTDWGTGWSTITPTSIDTGTYTPGSYSRTITFNYGLSAGNLTNGIGAMRFVMGVGFWQFAFDPYIDKNSDKTMSLTFQHSWSRAA